MSETQTPAQIDDGGAAFPTIPPYTPAGQWSSHVAHPGMSLRDYFAAAALQGMYAGAPHLLQEQIVQLADLMHAKTKEDAFARASYLTADAMLSARKDFNK